jgi:CDP-diacylglycerol--serine O-phosphatidyltransferase
VTLLVVVLVFVVITLKPAMILFILFFGYTLSGPIMTLKQLQQKRALRRQAKSQAKPEKSPATEPQNEPPTEETSKE